MDLLVGLGVLVLLIFFTTVLAFLIEYVPKEVPQLLIAVMMVGVYYYIGAEFVDDLQKFKSGIGLSFIIITMFRVVYFMIWAHKKNFLKKRT